MSDFGKDKLISSDGWPDCYPESNAYKPHCKEATPEGVMVCYRRVPGGHGRDNTITPEDERRL
jgi:hypothetical protein